MLYVELLRRCYSKIRSEMQELSPSDNLWHQAEAGRLLEDRLNDIVAEQIPVESNSYLELVGDKADELLGRTPDDIEVWVNSANVHNITPADIINMNIHDLIWEDIQQIFEETY